MISLVIPPKVRAQRGAGGEWRNTELTTQCLCGARPRPVPDQPVLDHVDARVRHGEQHQVARQQVRLSVYRREREKGADPVRRRAACSRLSVLAAITSTQQRLKLYNRGAATTSGCPRVVWTVLKPRTPWQSRPTASSSSSGRSSPTRARRRRCRLTLSRTSRSTRACTAATPTGNVSRPC